MRIFLYAGIAFLAVGFLFVFPSINDREIVSGWGFVLGSILLLIGVVLTAHSVPVRTRSRELKQEDQSTKLSVSRTQLVVALVIGAVFFTGFILVYPGGLLNSYVKFVTPTESPSQLFDGPERLYNVGDTLTFSLTPGYCRWDTEKLPQTTITRIKDADGKPDNKIIWTGTVDLRTPPECADYPGTNITYFKGTFKPLVLKEAGQYEVAVHLNYPSGNTRQFTVIK